MSVQPSSLAAISCTIFEDLLRDYTHELTQKIHRMSKLALQKCERCNTYCRQHCTKPGFDIYANNVQTPSSIPYYQCLSCRREIAASRYAAHMEKCKGRSLSSTTSYANLLEGDSANDDE